MPALVLSDLEHSLTKSMRTRGEQCARSSTIRLDKRALPDGPVTATVIGTYVDHVVLNYEDGELLAGRRLPDSEARRDRASPDSCGQGRIRGLYDPRRRRPVASRRRGRGAAREVGLLAALRKMATRPEVSFDDVFEEARRRVLVKVVPEEPEDSFRGELRP